MRNIFFPHYLSGEPVFKQKLNMNKQKKETLESVSLYACRGSNPGPSD